MYLLYLSMSLVINACSGTMTYRGIEVEHISNSSQTTKESIVILNGFPAYIERNTDFGYELNKQFGADVYIPHYKGLGVSKGKFSFYHSIEDMMSLVSHLKNKYKALTIVGHSWGGYLALSIADRIPVDELVLISPFVVFPEDNEIQAILDEFIQTERKMNREQKTLSELIEDLQLVRKDYPVNEELFRRVGTPVLVLQGLNDIVSIPRFSKDLFEKLGTDKKEYVEVETDHWFSDKREILKTMIVDWYKKKECEQNIIGK